MHGFICIDKPLGITSHDVVAIVRRISRIKRIGHAGTLDPGASGVLVLAIGPTTRLIEYVQDETRKTYVATITLGIATDSDDADGSVLSQMPVVAHPEATISTVLRSFVGAIMQIPPKVSAIHVDGKRMYDLARQGIAPDLPARPVHIYAITLLSFTADSLQVQVTCGKGTYIRSLARDIGAALGTVAHLSALRRTAVGSFSVETSVTIEQLQENGVTQWLKPNAVALADWPVHQATEIEIALIHNGMPIDCSFVDSQRVAIIDSTGELLATAVQRNAKLYPTKVFRWSEAS